MIPPFVALEGRFVRLEPFTPALEAEVGPAQDCDAETWSIMSVNGAGGAFAGWWAAAMAEQAAGQRMAYAVRALDSGRVVGATSYLALRAADRGLEIGASFLHPGARGGPANPKTKLLMMAHAFAAGIMRVEYMVDARNLRSQAAVAKLGAVREGTLRRHKVTWTGHLRDTVVFSITDLDWPRVRDGLERRLAAL